MKRRCVIDDGIGETRAAVYEGRALVELFVRRWSETDTPRLGDTFIGRIDEVDTGMGAAFVELGQGPQGFLKFTDAPNAPRFQIGQYVQVSISRESEIGKGPALKFIGLSETKKPGPLTQTSLQQQISHRFNGHIEFETAPVANLMDVCSRDLAVPGGGDIAVEPTRALIAIDVDRGSGRNGFDVSLNAAKLIAAQLRLRGLGGLVAIDFPNLRQKKQRDRLYDTMTEAVKGDPNVIKIAPLSRFGVMEMTRQKKQRALDEVLLDQFGQPTDETVALAGLQRLEKEAAISPGGKMTLSLPQAAYDWLQAGVIDWKSALTDRIGARFEVEQGAAMDVRSDR